MLIQNGAVICRLMPCVPEGHGFVPGQSSLIGLNGRKEESRIARTLSLGDAVFVKFLPQKSLTIFQCPEIYSQTYVL